MTGAGHSGTIPWGHSLHLETIAGETFSIIPYTECHSINSAVISTRNISMHTVDDL